MRMVSQPLFAMQFRYLLSLVVLLSCLLPSHSPLYQHLQHCKNLLTHRTARLLFQPLSVGPECSHLTQPDDCILLQWNMMKQSKRNMIIFTHKYCWVFCWQIQIEEIKHSVWVSLPSCLEAFPLCVLLEGASSQVMILTMVGHVNYHDHGND